MEADKNQASEKIGNASDIGSNSGAEGSQDQKEKVHGVDRAAEDSQPHEDESISKKRRKVGIASREAERYEDQDTATEPGNKNKDKRTNPHQTREQDEAPETTAADSGEWVTQYGNRSASLSSLDDQSQPQAPKNGPEAGMFLSGVELPIQPNKRKDIHTGSGADNRSEVPSTELTPKRPRRSTNEEGKPIDLNGGQDSPTKWAANEKRRAIKASPAKPNVATPESPAPSSRRRAQVTYKELSDEEEVDVPVFVSPPRAKSNKRGKAGVSTKQEVTEQLAPLARKGRKGIWDKEFLLTSKRSRLAKAADLSVRCTCTPKLLLQANISGCPQLYNLGYPFS